MELDILNVGLEVRKYTSLSDALPQSDVLYMTALQPERYMHLCNHGYQNISEWNQDYFIDVELLRLYAKPDLVIMHPLPRRGEVDERIDVDPRAAYFRQVCVCVCVCL